MFTKITIEGIQHILETLENGVPNYAAYTTSINTRTALQSAYDAGHWNHYTPAEIPLEPEPPNWQAFRLSLFHQKSFRQWAATLPADWREDLKACAILVNAEALQSTYTYLSSLSPPLPTAAAEWQAIATENRIPVRF